MNKSIALVVPRLDLPFKESLNFEKDGRKLPQHIIDVRKEWYTLFENIKEALGELGISFNEYLIPMWEMTDDFLSSLSEDIIFISHRNSLQVEVENKKNIYLMQVMTRWLFSIDSKGWGATLSNYPCVEFKNSSSNSKIFDLYRNNIIFKNQSKFDQKKSMSKVQLVLRGDLPMGEYLFFPCQIPHDQTIIYNSDVEEIDVINSLVEWAEKNRKHIVFKKHPVNLKSMEPFEPIIQSSKFCRWSDANINDLIKGSKGILTINSGVGFEAILHKKPVVTFGKIEYDVITHKGKLDNISQAYEYIKKFDFEKYKIDYYKFFNWYTRELCLDTTLKKRDQIDFLKNKLKLLLLN